MSQPSKLFRSIAVVALLFMFFVAGMWVFHYGLSAPMYYDSWYFLAARAQVFDQEGLRGVIQMYPQRPVTMVTFYANFLMAGMDPSSFRVVNLFFLSLTALVLTLIVRLALHVVWLPDGELSFEVTAMSLFCGLFFMVHPLQTMVTLYIWQRAALLACLFYFSSLLLYLASRCGKLQPAGAGYAGAFLLFLLGVFSKENVMTLPAVILLAEFAFFKTSWNGLVKKAAVLVILVLGVLLLESLIHTPYGNAYKSAGILGTISRYYQDCGLSLKSVILTQSRMLFAYGSTVFFPTPSLIHLLSPQVLSRSLLSPSITLAAAFGVLLIVILGLFLLSRRPLCGFGILFFVLNLIPEALLVPQFAFLGYRALLPMLGLLLAACDCLLLIFQRIARRPVPYQVVRCGAVLLAMVALFAIAQVSIAKAQLWHDPIACWRDMVDNFPADQHSVERTVRLHALMGLGFSLAQAGGFSEAIPYFQRAVEIVPESPEAHFHLGVVSSKTGDFPEAVRQLRIADRLKPGNSLYIRELKRALARMEESSTSPN